jgi:hypothetical protein
MGKPGRPSPGLDDYLYWQERLANREASGLSIDEFCVDEGVSRTTFYRWVQRLKGGDPGCGAGRGSESHVGGDRRAEVSARLCDGVAGRD